MVSISHRLVCPTTGSGINLDDISHIQHANYGAHIHSGSPVMGTTRKCVRPAWRQSSEHSMVTNKAQLRSSCGDGSWWSTPAALTQPQPCVWHAVRQSGGQAGRQGGGGAHTHTQTNKHTCVHPSNIAHLQTWSRSLRSVKSLKPER